MSEPFLGEIKMVGFNFAPRGWSFCDGQILPINQNQPLYSLLGTTYGGDGRNTFALPDMRSRTPLHRGEIHPLGQWGGAETVTLTANQMASHTHSVKGTAKEGTERTIGNKGDRLFAKLANSSGDFIFRVPEASKMTPLAAGIVSVTGNGQPHDNMQPYITLNFCIALQGLFPARN